MKIIRFDSKLLVTVISLVLISSCSGPKQVFYFQNGPATPKVAQKQVKTEPVYTASNTTTIAELPVAAASEEIAPATAITKKEMRKLLKQTLKAVKDTIRGKEKRVSVAVNKDRLGQLESEAKEIKNSVRVHNNDDKVVVDVKKPVTDFSSTELILLGVAALLILVILLSLPVLGTILGVALGIAVIAAALAILLGYVEINV